MNDILLRDIILIKRKKNTKFFEIIEHRTLNSLKIFIEHILRDFFFYRFLTWIGFTDFYHFTYFTVRKFLEIFHWYIVYRYTPKNKLTELPTLTSKT